ncbi:MAG: ABC transporter ATP-binding protein [Chloroflexi bacterium]|nr:ABC transporter ATP-binding protein [Chloroflexota bacterium]
MGILLRELGFLRKYWRRVVLAYLCLLGSATFSMATPWIVKGAIDVGLAQGDSSFLILSGLLIVGASLLRGGFAYGQTYLGEYLSQAVAYDLRNAIYDRLQRLSYAYHDQQQTGQLMSRATADVEAVRMFIFMGSVRAVFILTMLLVSCYLLISLNWSLTLVAFALLPFLGHRAVSTSLALRPNWLAVQQAVAVLGTILQENLSGIRVVKAFVREAFESQKFAGTAQEVRLLNYRTNRIQSANSALMSFIQVVIVAIILWYGGRQVMEGHLSLGGLVAFNAYLAMLAMPVRSLGWIANVFARAISSGERVFEILDAESAVKERPGARELPLARGHVRFDDVSFGYDAVSPVLRHVSFAAQPGQLVALLGATGSGKSTVVSLLPRFYDVTGGSITIDGADIRDVTLASLRRNVSIVHQDVFLFTATIRDNIRYGATEATQEEIEAATRTARLHDFIMGLPDGYDTWVGERGITLSGGQKQRVAIARTLLMDPRILILDDSTSSVDMETEYLIQVALGELMQGRTTFVIAQRLRTVLNADLILVLRDGQIVESGAHRELLEQGGLYREIYDLQLRDQEEAAAGVSGASTPSSPLLSTRP